MDVKGLLTAEFKRRQFRVASIRLTAGIPVARRVTEVQLYYLRVI